MAKEEPPPEHRPMGAEQNGSNIYWEVSGPNVGSAASVPARDVFEASPTTVSDREDSEDAVDVHITTDELLTSGIPGGHYVALAPGQNLKLTTRLDFHEPHRQAVFVGRGEIVVEDHVHGHSTRHFPLPLGRVEGNASPAIVKVVAANIRQKAIGWKSLGTHLILFFSSGDQVVTHLDSSVEYGYNSGGTWEFNLDALAHLCSAGGIAFESQSFKTAREFLETRPEWAPPLLEFQVDNVHEEDAREWGLALALLLPIAIGLLAVAGGVLLLLGPVGWVAGSLEVVGILVALVLTVWSHSRWREKRAQSRRRTVRQA